MMLFLGFPDIFLILMHGNKIHLVQLLKVPNSCVKVVTKPILLHVLLLTA